MAYYIFTHLYLNAFVSLYVLAQRNCHLDCIITELNQYSTSFFPSKRSHAKTTTVM